MFNLQETLKSHKKVTKSSFLWIEYLKKKPLFWVKLLGYSTSPESYVWTKFHVKIRLFNFLKDTIPKLFIKTVITPEGQCMGMNPSRLLLVSIDPNY